MTVKGVCKSLDTKLSSFYTFYTQEVARKLHTAAKMHYNLKYNCNKPQLSGDQSSTEWKPLTDSALVVLDLPFL